MDYEAVLNRGLDLLADGEEDGAERVFQSIIDHLKGRLDKTGADLDRYYYWGRALTAMEEYEQALLKFEKALKIDPGHEPTLWETASIFLHDMERPESAQSLLKEKLLPKSPGNPLYEEALKAAEFLVRLKKSPPPEAGGAKPGKDGKPKEKSAGIGEDEADEEGELRESGDSEGEDWEPDGDFGPKL